MDGKHAHVVRGALGCLAGHFCDPNPDESYLRAGPVAVARFEDDDADIGSDDEFRDNRLLRQRQVADLMAAFLEPLS